MDREEKIREFNKHREWEKNQLKVSPAKIVVTAVIAFAIMPFMYIAINWALNNLSSEAIQLMFGIPLIFLMGFHWWSGNNRNE